MTRWIWRRSASSTGVVGSRDARVAGPCPLVVWGLVAAMALPIAGFGAELEVANTNDAGPGSLREVLATAESNGEADVITITATGAIELASALPELTTELVILGSDADQIAITRAGDAPSFRILTIALGADVQLFDLTVAGGASVTNGGGIHSRGKLRLSRVVVENNQAGGVFPGGVEGNASGGGIFATDGGMLTIEDSTIRENRSFAPSMPLSTVGGGIYAGDGTALTLLRSTVSGNEASGFLASGGGVQLSGSDTVALIQSTTLADNHASGKPASCLNVNTIDADAATVVLQNTILATSVFAGNLNCNPCLPAPTSSGHNLSSNDTCELNGVGDQVDVNPMLAPLADNGGPTPTHGFLPGSPAIDRGHSGGLQTDQRGVVRVVDTPSLPNAPSGDGADIGAYEAGGLAPVRADVDYEAAFGSDANAVLEPGEQVLLAPVWQNAGTATVEVLSGEASSFTGPAGAEYELLASSVVYSPLDATETMSCRDQTACYGVEVVPQGPRPAPHWDASVDETLDDADGSTHSWILHIGDSYADVSRASPFYRFVETLLHQGITDGCTATEFCPWALNTRAQMSVFVLRAVEGGDYLPPPCQEGETTFADVPTGHMFCGWIEELAGRGVVSGCGGDNFCPDGRVTRAQMAVFLLKTLELPGYTPPSCSGVFADVPCPSPFANWIEDLSGRGITTGCAATPPSYCPSQPVSRQQMAVFLSRTFGLGLYDL